ncbi:MAG: lysylphosphatidylglycerol synthase transmembrane domain-containing protein [Promethearchaeia archaeon]
MNENRSKRISHWLKRRKKQLIIGIITVLLIIIMILFVDFASFLQKIIIIGPFGLIAFIITYTIAFILRAYKLKLIFKGISQEINYSTSYFSIGASFFINGVIPGKVGDVAKIFIIKDQENIGLGESTAGIAVERILDMILLFVISCFALIYLYLSNIGEASSKEFLGLSIEFYLIIGAALIIGILIIIFLSLYKTETIINIIAKISPKIAHYVGRFIINFKRGIKTLRENKKTLVYVILLGIPVYVIDGFIIVIFFYALGFQLNVLILILAINLSFFSQVFPITPGGWIISENIGSVFIFFFYPLFPGGYENILAIFIIEHLFKQVYILFFGGYSIFRFNFSLKQIEDLKE